MINWRWAYLSELTPFEVYELIAQREKTFVVEQRCPYLECDGIDKEALHLIGWSETTNGKQISAYLRVLPPGLKYPQASIGRVLTAKEARGTGIGKILMAKAIERIRNDYPGVDVKISAQSYLEKFYSGFGFKVISELYDDSGIPHIDMLLEAAA